MLQILIVVSKVHLVFSTICLILYWLGQIFYDRHRMKELQAEFHYKELSRKETVFNYFKFSIGCYIPVMNILIVITTFVANFGSKELIHRIEDIVNDVK